MIKRGAMKHYIYNNSQVGYFFIVLVVLIPFVLLVFGKGNSSGFYVTVSVLFLVIINFYNLNIKVDDNSIKWKFGIGLLSWNKNISEIKSVSQVRNCWYCGWGIRQLTDGTLYNVSGYDSVELTLDNGTKIRLGTDEPKRLSKAIKQVL